MFREHTDHEQDSLFGVQTNLSEARLKKLKNSMEAVFYTLVFRKIPEEEFAVLYSDQGSRPNTPVNQLVGAEILKHANGWTDEELMDQVHFDVKTRYALGIDELSEDVFCERTLYYFREKLEKYERETGVNLLERVFDELTDEQMETLNVETGIQRTDSFQAMSNIRTYTRLELAIEVLQRMWRVMDEADQSQWEERVAPWIDEDAGTILYTMEPSEYEDRFRELGCVYRDMYADLRDGYSNTQAFHAFERVYTEQFEVQGDKVDVRDDDDMDSGCMQSPDDEDATYRKKQGDEYRGQSAHVTETCDPANEFQLISDVFVTPNNIDDAPGLEDRLTQRPERYDSIDELFVDGAYGSEDTDEVLDDLEIDMVQTGIRGRPSDVEISIGPTGDGSYEVSCPNQTVESEPTRTRYKAVFDSEVCSGCPLAEDCPTQQQKQGRVYYFDESDAQRSQRLNRLEQMPEKKQTLRNNVEATVKEFTRGMNHNGKLRTRGQFKTKLYVLCTALGINVERIHRHLKGDEDTDGVMEALKGIFDDMSGLWTQFVEFGRKMIFGPSHQRKFSSTV